MLPWTPRVSTSSPVMVINLTVLTEVDLLTLWFSGFSVGAEIDRRQLGQPRG